MKDQFWRWKSSSLCLLQATWRQPWKDKGEGSSKGDDFKGRYPRTPCQAIDGVLPLHNLCTQVCNQHGRVNKMKHSSQCKESPYLQL